MMISQWKAAARKNGWLIRSPADGCGSRLHLHCDKQGCTGSLILHVSNLGPVPEPCQRPHHKQFAADTFQLYRDTVTELRRRRVMLGLSQETLCAVAGLADGHINKLENMDRIARFETLHLWAQCLGLSLTLQPVALPKRTQQAIERETYQHHQARFAGDTAKAIGHE